MKAHWGIAVPLEILNGYLTIRQSTEINSGQDLLGHRDIIAIFAPLGPCLRRSVLTGCTRRIQTRRWLSSDAQKRRVRRTNLYITVLQPHFKPFVSPFLGPAYEDLGASDSGSLTPASASLSKRLSCRRFDSDTYQTPGTPLVSTRRLHMSSDSSSSSTVITRKRKVAKGIRGRKQITHTLVTSKGEVARHTKTKQTHPFPTW